MKKLIALLLLAAPLMAFAQKDITALYNSYADKKGIQTILMGPEMFRSMVLKTTGNATETFNCTLMVIAAESSLSFTAKDMRLLKDEAMRIASAPGYKMLMDVKEDRETVRIYAREGKSKNNLSGVIIIVDEGDEITVVGIDGEIPSNYLTQLPGLIDD